MQGVTSSFTTTMEGIWVLSQTRYTGCCKVFTNWSSILTRNSLPTKDGVCCHALPGRQGLILIVSHITCFYNWCKALKIRPQIAFLKFYVWHHSIDSVKVHSKFKALEYDISSVCLNPETLNLAIFNSTKVNAFRIWHYQLFTRTQDHPDLYNYNFKSLFSL